jgi:GTP cyclohydrolase II
METAMKCKHAKSKLKTIYGIATLHCFSFGKHEDDNILCIKPVIKKNVVSRTLVRIQSACYTAEIFRSLDCDCHEQLDESLRKIHIYGGLLIYMLRDGRGAGLIAKTKALNLFAERGIDTHDAYKELGIPIDSRTYDKVLYVLRFFKTTSVRLLTNNPSKISALQNAQIKVQRIPLIIKPTMQSLPYLLTKQKKMGHLLNIPKGKIN